MIGTVIRCAPLVSMCAIAGPALAESPAWVDAPAPCVNRESQWWRAVRDPILDATSLQYCTGADCWTLDLAANTVAPAPPRPQVRPLRDEPGYLTDGHGTTLAHATETEVSFCPRGPSSCRVFHYRFGNAAANGVFPMMNEARTLGAVIYLGESEAGDPSFVLAYDLVAMKPIVKRKASDLTALGHGFLLDGRELYSAGWKKVGALAVHDEAWLALGATDLLALHDREHGTFVIQSAATGKVKARIAHGVADRATWFQLVASPDGATLYAIGSQSDEGEVLTIDVAAGKIIRRATPTPCAPGTHRLQQ